MVERDFEFFLPGLSRYQVPGVQTRMQARFILEASGDCLHRLRVATPIGKEDMEGLLASGILSAPAVDSRCGLPYCAATGGQR